MFNVKSRIDALAARRVAIAQSMESMVAAAEAEHRTFNIPGAGVSLRTVSEDEVTLVQTFSGVKVLRIKSRIFSAETL